MSFALINNSDKDVSLSCFGIGTGEVRLLISRDKKEFLEYKNSEWGTVDAVCHNLLKPADKIEIPSMKILWNYKANISHLSKNAAKEFTKGYIANDYAFPEAGTYFVKALAFGNDLSSEPIQIDITEPQGEDLEIWNKIKDDGNFAYFIQEGEILILDYKPKERAEFEQKVEEILTQYPNSFYTQALNQSLEKFKANEARRQAFEEKIKANKP